MPPAAASVAGGASALTAMGVGVGRHEAAGGAPCASAAAAEVRQRPDNNAALRRSVRRPVLIVLFGSIGRRLLLRAGARLAQLFAQERELRVARVGLLQARERGLGLGELLRLQKHEREVVQAVDVVRIFVEAPAQLADGLLRLARLAQEEGERELGARLTVVRA